MLDDVTQQKRNSNKCYISALDIYRYRLVADLRDVWEYIIILRYGVIYNLLSKFYYR